MEVLTLINFCLQAGAKVKADMGGPYAVVPMDEVDPSASLRSYTLPAVLKFQQENFSWRHGAEVHKGWAAVQVAPSVVRHAHCHMAGSRVYRCFMEKMNQGSISIF